MSCPPSFYHLASVTGTGTLRSASAGHGENGLRRCIRQLPFHLFGTVSYDLTAEKSRLHPIRFAVLRVDAIRFRDQNGLLLHVYSPVYDHGAAAGRFP